jgi:hypothetical protein
MIVGKRPSSIDTVPNRNRRGQYWELQEKGIGRQIGRAARRVRGGKPLDGDGDGMYSPRPGAPDKTPVPMDAVQAPAKPKASRNWKERIGERLADAAEVVEPKKKPKSNRQDKPKKPKPTKERKPNWLERIADGIDPDKKKNRDEDSKKTERKTRAYKKLKVHERALAMRDEMIEEYGFPKTHDEAEQMLRKAFPNVKVEGNPNRKLQTGESMAVLGLMAASEDFPEAAKLLTVVEFQRKRTRFVASAGPKRNDDEDGPIGWGIYYSRKINGFPFAGRYTMSQTIATETKNAGLSDADAEAASSIATSLHEMGHIQHNAKTLEWLGGWEGAIKAGMGWDDEKFNRYLDTVMARLQDTYDRSPDYPGKKPPTREDAINRIAKENFNMLTEKVMGRQKSKLDFDGLTDEEVKDAIAGMGITQYATQSHREGVAETLAARSLGVDVAENAFHQWLAPDVKAEPQSAPIEYDGFKPDCIGYEYPERRGRQNQQEKGLGRTLGRTGRRVRRGSKPLDGDGDGFYSPRPGAPDKTPVPASMAVNAVDAPKKPKASRNWKERIGDRLAGAADELERTKPKDPKRSNTSAPKKPKEPKKLKERGGNWLERIADQLDPDKRDKDKKKRKPRPYDDLNGHEKVLSMYDEMAKEHGVPKTNGEAQEILRKSYPNIVVAGKASDSIQKSEAAAVLAMMAGAEYFPEAAEFIGQFRIGDRNDGALASAGVGAEGLFFISLKQSINDSSPGLRNYLVASQMAYAALDAGGSDEEMRRIIAMGATLHELAHMQHFSRQMEWVGGPRGALKKLRNYTDESIDAKIKLYRDQILAKFDAISDEEKAKLSKPDVSDEAMLKLVMRQEYYEIGTHFIGATKETMYDSLSEEEIVESREVMGVSTYAKRNDMEGIAESISARLLGIEAPDNPLHRWIAPDVKADNKTANDELKFQTCRGYNTSPPGKKTVDTVRQRHGEYGDL